MESINFMESSFDHDQETLNFPKDILLESQGNIELFKLHFEITQVIETF